VSQAARLDRVQSLTALGTTLLDAVSPTGSPAGLMVFPGGSAELQPREIPRRPAFGSRDDAAPIPAARMLRWGSELFSMRKAAGHPTGGLALSRELLARHAGWIRNLPARRRSLAPLIPLDRLQLR